jgi:hypothetical protein
MLIIPSLLIKPYLLLIFILESPSLNTNPALNEDGFIILGFAALLLVKFIREIMHVSKRNLKNNFDIHCLVLCTLKHPKLMPKMLYK